MYLPLYLYWHFLNHSVQTQNQTWLTCENPLDLVQKYGEYHAHGYINNRDEKPGVLDEDALHDTSRTDNLRIISRKDLVETFLETIKEQAQACFAHPEQEQENLLILIFGYGSLSGI